MDPVDEHSCLKVACSFRAIMVKSSYYIQTFIAKLKYTDVQAYDMPSSGKCKESFITETIQYAIQVNNYTCCICVNPNFKLKLFSKLPAFTKPNWWTYTTYPTRWLDVKKSLIYKA